jgi:hypothetical protein
MEWLCLFMLAALILGIAAHLLDRAGWLD